MIIIIDDFANFARMPLLRPILKTPNQFVNLAYQTEGTETHICVTAKLQNQYSLTNSNVQISAKVLVIVVVPVVIPNFLGNRVVIHSFVGNKVIKSYFCTYTYLNEIKTVIYLSICTVSAKEKGLPKSVVGSLMVTYG